MENDASNVRLYFLWVSEFPGMRSQTLTDHVISDYYIISTSLQWTMESPLPLDWNLQYSFITPDGNFKYGNWLTIKDIREMVSKVKVIYID